MKDPELTMLKNRTLLGITVCIVLLTPFFLFIFNKLNQDDSKIVREIKEKNTFYLYIRDNKTTNKYQKELRKENLLYYKINKDLSRDYEKVLATLDITETDIVPPTVIYIREGQTVAILNNIKSEEEIITFLENYKGGE